MKYWVGVTDNHWFDFLSKHNPDEVNFWRPKSLNQFRAIDPGVLFLFKLHSPLNYIAGGGFLFRHTFLPLSMAWEAFQENNGVATYREFWHAINRIRKDDEKDPTIGCTLLTNPFFWEREKWIPVPEDWSPSLVQGKGYDSQDGGYGEDLWKKVQLNLLSENKPAKTGVIEERDPSTAYGRPVLHQPRLGQGAFRVGVADAYQRRYALTGENTLYVLEAAHIQPFSLSKSHAISNGLFLRSDYHTLFDKGLITVTPDYEIQISEKIKADFNNGKIYYERHGKELVSIPSEQTWMPDRELLEWHQQEVFVG